MNAEWLQECTLFLHTPHTNTRIHIPARHQHSMPASSPHLPPDNAVVADSDAISTPQTSPEKNEQASPPQPQPGPVHTLVKWLSESISGSSEEYRQREQLIQVLGKSTMFRELTNKQREKIADACVLVRFKRGDILQLQDAPQEKAFIIIEGECMRQRTVDDNVHVVGSLGYADSTSTVGMLHLLSSQPSFATLKASTSGLAFQIHSQDLRQILLTEPDVALGAIQSLCREVIEMNANNLGQTPLFMNQSKSLPWLAISCASAVESFYRSAMNSLINSALTGKPRAALFPNMHIQIPTRIVYFNGFKGIRYFVDTNCADLQDRFERPQLVAMLLATVPGVVMTPISSILEASNAGHMNPEPIATRWTRGLLPRCAREVIFGMGLNQLTDYYAERMPMFKDPKWKALGASFVSGLIAGYISHVPHSMSALKLVYPQKTYRELFSSYTAHWDRIVPQGTWPQRRLTVNLMACLLPKGCLVRSTQIAGSFIIINSLVNSLKHFKVDIQDLRNMRTASD